MKLTIEMKGRLQDGLLFDTRIHFKKIHDHLGRHWTTAVVKVREGAQPERVVASGSTRLGVQDAERGRYSFWAGARIALSRALLTLSREYGIGTAKAIRRAAQIQLSLDENDEAGAATYEKLQHLSAQRDQLLAEKQRIIEPDFVSLDLLEGDEPKLHPGLTFRQALAEIERGFEAAEQAKDGDR